jgi:hypothetical protein
MIFDKVHLLFRIRIQIHNLKLRIRIRIRILQNVSDPYGSGSTTLDFTVPLIMNLKTHILWTDSYESPEVPAPPAQPGSSHGLVETWIIQSSIFQCLWPRGKVFCIQ